MIIEKKTYLDCTMTRSSELVDVKILWERLMLDLFLFVYLKKKKSWKSQKDGYFLEKERRLLINEGLRYDSSFVLRS